MVDQPTPELKAYSLPADLVQAIVHCLNTQPAGNVRGLLNALEAEVVTQDKAAKQGLESATNLRKKK